MLIPKKNRIEIYMYLLKEGVMVVKEDFTKLKHDELDVPNLHVLKLLQSLKSRGLVKNQFSWQWQYYYLTDDGIAYLREYLHVPDDVVPKTQKKDNKPPPGLVGEGGPRGFGKGGDRGDRGPRANDRGE
jgi:small subunit ribosomal protein S10e